MNNSRPLTGNKISKRISTNGISRPKTGVTQLKWDIVVIKKRIFITI